MEIQDALYYERMDSSIGDKKKIIPHIVGSTVLDVGCGDGVLMEAMRAYGFDVYGLDATEESVARAEQRGFEGKVALAYAHEALETYGPNKFDTIVCSAIIHEVYSYGTPEDGILSIEAVRRTFETLLAVLKPGGRLIIRDGVIPEQWNDVVQIIFQPENPTTQIHLVQKYLDMIPFRGDINTPTYREVDLRKLGTFVYEGTFESAMEFLYTYTWGEKAYPRETKELYGFHTLKNYVKFLEEFNLSVLHSEEYLQDGYRDHLKNRVTIFKDWEVVEFPSSNLLLVAEKS